MSCGTPCRLASPGMLAHVTTFAIQGVESRRVTVEVDIRPGLPAFTIVGLGDRAVRESRERVRSAILNSGFEFPARRITVNLAPAALRKEGPGFDLAIACGVLAAVGRAAGVRRWSASPSSASSRWAASCARVAVCSRWPRARSRQGWAASCCPPSTDGRRRWSRTWASTAPIGLGRGRGDPARGERRPAAATRRWWRGGARGARARSRRRARPRRPAAGARDRGGRRPQPAARRSARHGQDDARAAAAVDPAAAVACRGDRGHADPGRRRASGRAAAS